MRDEDLGNGSLGGRRISLHIHTDVVFIYLLKLISNVYILTRLFLILTHTDTDRSCSSLLISTLCLLILMIADASLHVLSAQKCTIM